MTDWYSEVTKPQKAENAGGTDWYSEVTKPQSQSANPAQADGKKPMADIVREKMPEGYDFSFGRMVGNIPESGGKLVSDISTAIAHPVDTAKAVGNVALGAVDKSAETLAESLPESWSRNINKFNNYLVDLGLPLERLPDNPDDMDFEHTKYADSLIDFFGERYGSKDAFLRTLETDPIGTLSDATGLLMGAGSIAPKLGKVGAAVDPVNITVRGTGKAITNIPGIKELPSKLYQSAAKFGTTVSPAKRKAMTETALANQVMPRSAGVAKLDDLIDSLNTQIDDFVAETALSGEKVPRRVIYQYINRVKNEVGGMNLDATKDVEKINRLINSFEDHLDNIGKKELTAKDLQDLKRSTYKSIDFDKKKMKGSQAVEKTRKAIARAAKEEIEKLIPEVKQLNAKEGDLIELKEALEKAANRIENRDLIGIGMPIKGGLGAMVGGTPGAAAAITVGLFDTPTVKAKLALILDKIQKMDIPNDRKLAIRAQVAKFLGRTEESLGNPVVDEENGKVKDNASNNSK